MPGFTGGDVTNSAGSVALALATVNSNVGVCGDATHVGQVTLDAKGRAAACAAVAIAMGGAVSSVFGRAGAVAAANGDYSFSQISGLAAAGQIQP